MKAAKPESSQQSSYDAREAEAIWKSKLLDCMKQVSPDFTVDDRNRRILDALYRWVWERAGRSMGGTLDTTKGILLCGPIGTGKSTLMKGLQKYESLVNRYGFAFGRKDLGFSFVSAAEISLCYAEQGIDGIIRYTQRECATGLCIDELGREPVDAKHFGTNLNVIQTVLQLRYEFRYECLTYGTTNMGLEDIPQRYGTYIADRCKEMFNILHLGGETRRK